MSFHNRLAARDSQMRMMANDPTPEQIARECQEIQSCWSQETLRRRSIPQRFDAASPVCSANLTFLRFLADYVDAQSS